MESNNFTMNQTMYDTICMVIDMDGFTISGEFIVRELSYAALTAEESGVFCFDPRIYIKTLSHTDKSTAGYAAYQIHEMYMIPEVDEPTCKITNLTKIVSMLYDKYKQPDQAVVGYKGGRKEKDLLENLDIPCLNIETLGCPCYEKIDTTDFTDISDSCEFLRHFRGKGYSHFSRREAEVFREWLKHTYSGIDASAIDVYASYIPETQEMYDPNDDNLEFSDLLVVNPSQKRYVYGHFKLRQCF